MRDIDLVTTDGLKYSLSDPVDDIDRRLRNRFLSQLLSRRHNDPARGTLLMSTLEAGRLKTSSNIVTTVATAMTQATLVNRELAEEAYPQSTRLERYELVDQNTLKLTISMEGVNGNVLNDVVVTAP